MDYYKRHLIRDFKLSYLLNVEQLLRFAIGSGTNAD
jgi:hypothetical protein